MKKDPGSFPIFQMIFPEKRIKKWKFYSKFGSLKYSDIPYDGRGGERGGGNGANKGTQSDALTQALIVQNQAAVENSNVDVIGVVNGVLSKFILSKILRRILLKCIWRRSNACKLFISLIVYIVKGPQIKPKRHLKDIYTTKR